MRKSTKQRLDEIEKKVDDAFYSFKSFQRETNYTIDSLRKNFNEITLGPKSSATKNELNSLSKMTEAKIDALEHSFNEILGVLELKKIKKTNCPECKQELPEDYNDN